MLLFFFAASIVSYVVITLTVLTDETIFFTPCDPQPGSEEGEIQYHVPGRMNLFSLDFSSVPGETSPQFAHASRTPP